MMNHYIISRVALNERGEVARAEWSIAKNEIEPFSGPMVVDSKAVVQEIRRGARVFAHFPEGDHVVAVPVGIHAPRGDEALVTRSTDGAGRPWSKVPSL